MLFAVSYVAIYFREWLAQSEFENWFAIQLHMSVGISIGIIVILRILWRALNPVPTNEAKSHLIVTSKRLVHFSLYAIMFTIPITGYLSIANYLHSGGGKIDFFFVYDLDFSWDIEIQNVAGTTIESLEKAAELVHVFLGKWIAGLLIILHIFAASYHHFIRKDNTLRKMFF